MPTTTAPMFMIAQSSRIHSSRVRASTATTSPRCTPRASRARESASTRRPASSPEPAPPPPAGPSREAAAGHRCSSTYRQRTGAVRRASGESVGLVAGEAVVTFRIVRRRKAMGEGEKPWSLYNSDSSHADYLERLHLIRPGQHPDWPGLGDPANGRLVPDAASRVRDADQAEALVPGARA